jgi:hypothetical protein
MRMIDTRPPMEELQNELNSQSTLLAVVNESGCSKTSSIIDCLRKSYGLYFEVPDITGPLPSGEHFQKFVDEIQTAKSGAIKANDQSQRQSEFENKTKLRLYMLLGIGDFIITVPNSKIVSTATPTNIGLFKMTVDVIPSVNPCKFGRDPNSILPPNAAQMTMDLNFVSNYQTPGER